MTQTRKSPGESGANSKCKSFASPRKPFYSNSHPLRRGQPTAKHLKSVIDTAYFYSRETGVNLPDAPEKWVTARCPLHHDKHPSLRVLIPDGAFRCMACDAHGGDIIDFVRQRYGMSFLEALSYLDERYGRWRR